MNESTVKRKGRRILLFFLLAFSAVSPLYAQRSIFRSVGDKTDERLKTVNQTPATEKNQKDTSSATKPALDPLSLLGERPKTLAQSIQIPPEFGRISETYEGNPKPLIIHIQDVHVHYEAQKNLANILDKLVKDNGLRLILVEGGSGDTSLSFLRAEASKEKRLEVAEKYLKLGKISGEEYLDIISDSPITLWGIEEEKLYDANLDIFFKVDAIKGKATEAAHALKKIVDALKANIYSPGIKELEQKKREYEDGKVQAIEYYQYLGLLAQAQNVDLSRYPNFRNFLQASILEKVIDFQKVDGQHQALIGKLTQVLSKEELTTLAEKGLKYKLNQAGPGEYYGFLKEILQKSDPQPGTHQDLDRYIDYVILYAGRDHVELFREGKILEKEIKGKLYTSNDERTLSEVSDRLDLLLNFLDLNLSPDDLKTYQVDRKSFLVKEWRKFLLDKMDQYHVSLLFPQDLSIIDNNWGLLESFYELGMKRDTALVKNAIAKVNAEKVDVVVLIAGGFHTEQITRLLKEQNYSYVVVAPKITQASDLELYHRILKEKAKPETPADENLRQVPALERGVAGDFRQDARDGGGKETRELAGIIRALQRDITLQEGKLRGMDPSSEKSALAGEIKKMRKRLRSLEHFARKETRERGQGEETVSLDFSELRVLARDYLGIYGDALHRLSQRLDLKSKEAPKRVKEINATGAALYELFSSSPDPLAQKIASVASYLKLADIAMMREYAGGHLETYVGQLTELLRQFASGKGPMVSRDGGVKEVWERYKERRLGESYSEKVEAILAGHVKDDISPVPELMDLCRNIGSIATEGSALTDKREAIWVIGEFASATPEVFEFLDREDWSGGGVTITAQKAVQRITYRTGEDREGRGVALSKRIEGLKQEIVTLRGIIRSEMPDRVHIHLSSQLKSAETILAVLEDEKKQTSSDGGYKILGDPALVVGLEHAALIGDGVVLDVSNGKPIRIGKGARILGNSYVRESSIGDHAVVESALLDGAFVGKDAFVKGVVLRTVSRLESWALDKEKRYQVTGQMTQVGEGAKVTGHAVLVNTTVGKESVLSGGVYQYSEIGARNQLSHTKMTLVHTEHEVVLKGTPEMPLEVSEAWLGYQFYADKQSFIDSVLHTNEIASLRFNPNTGRVEEKKHFHLPARSFIGRNVVYSSYSGAPDPLKKHRNGLFQSKFGTREGGNEPPVRILGIDGTESSEHGYLVVDPLSILVGPLRWVSLPGPRPSSNPVSLAAYRDLTHAMSFSVVGAPLVKGKGFDDWGAALPGAAKYGLSRKDISVPYLFTYSPDTIFALMKQVTDTLQPGEKSKYDDFVVEMLETGRALLQRELYDERQKFHGDQDKHRMAQLEKWIAAYTAHINSGAWQFQNGEPLGWRFENGEWVHQTFDLRKLAQEVDGVEANVYRQKFFKDLLEKELPIPLDTLENYEPILTESHLPQLTTKGNVLIGPEVVVEEGAVIGPGVVLEGKTVIRKGARVFGSQFKDSTVGENVFVWGSKLESSEVGEGSQVILSFLSKETVGKKVEFASSRLEDSRVGDQTVGNGVLVEKSSVGKNQLLEPYAAVISSEVRDTKAGVNRGIGSRLYNSTVSGLFTDHHLAGRVSHISALPVPFHDANGNLRFVPNDSNWGEDLL